MTLASTNRISRVVVYDETGKVVGFVESRGSTFRLFVAPTFALLKEYVSLQEALNALATALGINVPVNCLLAPTWNAWVTTNLTACVGDLRVRTEERTRDVITQPSNGGTACGPTFETRDVEEACSSSIDCVLSAYGAWTPTGAWGACVDDLQTRTEQRSRTVVTQPENGGAACGVLTETREVEQACLSPVDCVLSAWGAWTPTSAWDACVESLQHRNEQRIRTVVTEPANGGAVCGVLSETREVSQACVADVPPPVDCVLSAWGAWTPTGNWSACVADEQTRTEQRTRTVTTQPAEGGLACGVLTETREVSQACLSPVDCVLSAFGAWTPTSDWGACVADLQTRTEQRSRTIDTEPANGGVACGSLTETRDVEQACVTPIDCVLAASWNAWITTNLTTCVGSLRTRTEERTRNIVTQPVGTGALCGPTFETRDTEEACVMPPVESADGTRGATVTDSELSVWTFGANGETLRNGINFNFGQGSEYVYKTSIVYHKGNNGHYYSWGGSAWVDGGFQDPTLPTMSVDHFRVPDDGPSITDNVGRVWTIVGGQDVYVNGAYFFGGWANMLLFEHDDMFVHLRRPNTLVWHHRDETATPPWVDTGTDDPETGPPAPPPADTGLFQTTLSAQMTLGASQITVVDGTVFPQAAIDAGTCWLGIPTGYETTPNPGKRGTGGVGGYWPDGATYATVAAMQADLANRGNLVHTWVVDTGNVYFKSTNFWQKMADFDNGKYYNAKANPRALISRVISKSGNVLTLAGGFKNGVAQKTVPAGTPVYRDLTQTINAAIVAAANNTSGNLASNTVINLNTLFSGATSGVLAGVVTFPSNKTGITLTCDSIGSFRLYSPPGFPCIQVKMDGCTKCTIDKITLQGNLSDDNGFVGNFEGSTTSGSQNSAGSFWLQGTGWTIAVFAVSCNGCESRNVSVIDSPIAFRSLACTNTHWRNPKYTATFPLRDYLQHAIMHDNGASGGPCNIYDPVVISDHVLPGVEIYNGSGAIFRPVTRNGMVSFNNAKNWRCGADPENSQLGAGELRFTTGASVANQGIGTTADAISINYCVSINSNGGTNNGAAGGTLLNLSVVVEGYQRPTGEVSPGVIVDDRNPEVTLDGFHFSAPNWKAGASTSGSAIIHGGHRGLVKNSLVIGTAKNDIPLHSNIYASDVISPSLCINNVADTIRINTI